MGLPKANDEGISTPAATYAPASATSNASSTQQRPQLPPEALELATKLFDLAREGQTSALGQYLQAGIPPNLTNHKGDTLLMLASYHDHIETVRMLLRRGADPDVLNDRGQSIIAGAVFKGHDEVVEVLFRGVDGGKGADVYKGQPNAVDSAKMFKREAMLELFGVVDDGARPWEGGASTAPL